MTTYIKIIQFNNASLNYNLTKEKSKQYLIVSQNLKISYLYHLN